MPEFDEAYEDFIGKVMPNVGYPPGSIEDQVFRVWVDYYEGKITLAKALAKEAVITGNPIDVRMP